VNSILSLNPKENNINQQQFAAAMSRVTVCFGKFFSRCLLKQFNLRSPWKKWSLWHQLQVLDVLNDEFVTRLIGLVPAYLYHDYIVFSSCALSLPLLCLYWLVQLLEICLSQGSVATRFWCDGIFNDSFIANLL